MPSVAMNRMMPSWLTRWRSTRSSIAYASTIMTPTVSAIATIIGIISESRASVSAARNTIAPWAKLNTPEALKISTKPSATSEYITPASSPPMSTSKKNCMLVRDAEVGVDHAVVAAHLLGRAVCDLAAVIEHHHAVRQIHHHAHVVLDQHHRRADLIIDVEDEAAHVLLLLEIHPRHRLVEQQQLGLCGQSTPELDALLQPVGQPAHGSLAHVLDLEEIDHRLDLLAVLELLAPGCAQVEGLLEDVARHLEIAAGHQIVEHAHAAEERDVLEGPRDALLRGFVRVDPAALASPERYRAPLRVIHAVDDVEHRGLARAVRADDGAHLVLAHVEGNPLQRDDTPESERYVLDLEQRRSGRSRDHAALR